MTRVPEPTVHVFEPYTKRQWRCDVGREKRWQALWYFLNTERLRSRVFSVQSPKEAP